MKRRHFHHRVGDSGCTNESVAHLVAKELVVEAVRLHRDAEGPSPRFVRACAQPGCDAETEQPLPSKVRRAVTEHRLKGGRVVDVALLGPGDLVIAAIEVLQTHAVDEAKAAELAIPWIEVDAITTCAARGLLLRPTRDRFLPWLCDAHSTKRRDVVASAQGERREVHALAQRRARVIAKLPFSLDEYPSYRPGELCTCVNGHDAVTLEWKGRYPPEPRPDLIKVRERDLDVRYDPTENKLRAALPYRRYWVSVCALCGADLT